MATTKVRVTFEEAKQMLRGTLRGQARISFEFDNESRQHEALPSISTAVLYKDWWGDCCYCPNNDTTVTHLQFNLAGKQINVYDGVNFGSLMEFISKEMRGRKAPEDK